MKLKPRTFLIGFLLSAALGITLFGAPATSLAAEPLAKEAAEKSADQTSAPLQKIEEKITQTPEAGKNIFGERNCSACHLASGPENKIPVTERTAIKGPSLWFAGSKFRSGYLAAWLAAPKSFRGVKWGTMNKGTTPHPALPKGEAGAVAAYLESLRDSEMPRDVINVEKKISRRDLRTARILFQKKQPCYACHRVKIRKTVYRRPIKLGGFSGPHLIDAGLRLQPDFIVAFLKNPARYNPNGRMPVYSDKAFTRLSDKDIIALAAYISSFKEKP
ncbi:MAG: cytochrome c [Nitrospinaceae bacterium]|nr:cytochrome c [Nitrospinaceae bacterium]MBT3433391.1 cytochrome c [Nitrospinaceae bacterium]MBT3821494.1 cytochrome c [Nitrospinaceae bacterium]MBT4093599.1 cytochrome c [Nitrospinaceae bacterium]MBT4429388.1 cytochrome c [Nitrospinaceae bacterium]